MPCSSRLYVPCKSAFGICFVARKNRTRVFPRILDSVCNERGLKSWKSISFIKLYL